MLNRIIIMGRLTRDPELRRTQSGTAVTSFSLAVEDDFKDKETGEKKVYFIDCVAWRNTAEFICKYFTKGRTMAIDGKIQTRTWEDKEGSHRKAVEIVAESAYFGDSNRSEGSNSADAQASAYAPTGSFAEVEDDGKLPF